MQIKYLLMNHLKKFVSIVIRVWQSGSWFID